MASEIDPSIFYCFVLEDDDPYKTSPFQGFSPTWMTLPWAMLRLIDLPADVLEPALPHKAVLARRMGGTGGWHWFSLPLRALDHVSIEQTAPFWVIFSGTQTVAKAVSAWAETQIIHPLHVTSGPWDDAITKEALTTTVVREHIVATLRDVRQRDSKLHGDLIDQACAAWRDRPCVNAEFPKLEHNCTLPNHMVLEAAGVRFEKTVPLISQSTEKYIAAIRETAEAVSRLRQDVGHVPGFRLTPPQPALILTAPALYRHAYQNTRSVSRDDTKDPQIVNKVMRFFQRQKTFQWSLEKEEHERLLVSEEAKRIVQTRQKELEIHTLTVGLRAASTLATTIRVPPAVNRTAGVVRQFAAHTRSIKNSHPQKFARLFSVVQEALSEAVGPELLQLIADTEGGIKLVTDAPMEWLPISALPLSLKFDCSRITATPGNLMVAELTLPFLLRLKTSAFSDVLIISAYDAKDPIRHMIPAALEAVEPMWRDKFTVRSVTVEDEVAFCNALNAYDGGILIFDGHGHHSEDTGVGTLAIGDNDVNVLSLRGRVRVPPVVVLSACDTQAADRSHATTANAFLALGARAVLGTLLPLDSRQAAIFIGRLLYRLVDFLPAAIAGRGEAIQWSEVVSGLLRMQLVTDLLRPYHGREILSRENYEYIHAQGNMAINTRRSDWFEFFTGLTAEHSSLSLDQVQQDFRTCIPTSDTIRYVHMGNPETILIDDPSTMELIEAALMQPEPTP